MGRRRRRRVGWQKTRSWKKKKTLKRKVWDLRGRGPSCRQRADKTRLTFRVGPLENCIIMLNLQSVREKESTRCTEDVVVTRRTPTKWIYECARDLRRCPTSSFSSCAFSSREGAGVVWIYSYELYTHLYAPRMYIIFSSREEKI